MRDQAAVAAAADEESVGGYLCCRGPDELIMLRWTLRCGSPCRIRIESGLCSLSFCQQWMAI